MLVKGSRGINSIQGMVLWSVSHKVTKRVTWFSIDCKMFREQADF